MNLVSYTESFLYIPYLEHLIMAQQAFDLTRIAPAKNSECIYVWLTKANESDFLCCYSFAAEIWQRNASSKHMVAVQSEEGTLEIDKRNASCSVLCKSRRKTHSICDRIRSELKDSLQQRGYPHFHFLAFCDPSTQVDAKSSRS